MKSIELRELTSSEPLSLEEEYDMQRSWRNDEDKCTFLILSKEVFDQNGDEIESLIGDTNIFLQNDISYNSQQIRIKTAEVEIMIAEQKFRGKKLGWEAMLLMLKYGLNHLKINHFIAKINVNNNKSISMFRKLFFEEVSRSQVFREITFQKIVNPFWITWLDKQVNLNIQTYTDK